MLKTNGFVNAYTIIDRIEGDKVDDPTSVYFGKRMKNGWKNSGLPWIYDVNPELIGYPSVKRQSLSDASLPVAERPAV